MSELEEIYRAAIERGCGRAANQAAPQAGDFDEIWPENLPADFPG